jgi:endogenous inhibitor of DNA gyrase (YacG/DUF329 family)
MSSSTNLAVSTSAPEAHKHHLGLYVLPTEGEPIGDCIVEGYGDTVERCGGTVLRFTQDVQRPGESEVTQSIRLACNRCGSSVVHSPDSASGYKELDLLCEGCGGCLPLTGERKCPRCGHVNPPPSTRNCKS